MARASILVVDDYEDSRELYAEYLRFAGYEVTTAADGDAALHCALKNSCDAIVLDLALPKLDGLAVLRLLRSASKTRAVPVIVLSGSSVPELQGQAIAAGANRFLTKPCSPEELEQALRETLADTLQRS